MSTSDKTLLGFCLLSLITGFVQHGCSKNKRDHLTKKTVAAVASTRSGPLSTHQKGEKTAPPISYVVETYPRKDAHLSLNEKRLAAIRERNEKMDSPQTIPLAEDLNYFDAREGLKDMLFNDFLTGETNTLNTAEKWEFIESGNLPW